MTSPSTGFAPDDNRLGREPSSTPPADLGGVSLLVVTPTVTHAELDRVHAELAMATAYVVRLGSSRMRCSMRNRWRFTSKGVAALRAMRRVAR